MEFPAFMQSWAFIVTCALLSYASFQELTARRERRRKAEQLGCKPAFRAPAWDPFFGLDFLIRGLNALRNKNLLQEYHTIFEDNATTLHMKVLTMPEIQTTEPENVQAVLQSKFADFGLGPRRQHFLGPLVGHGIFTTEGPAWKHSRQLLRPNLTQNLSDNLPMFERHIHNLLARIPRNGECVDLQHLFYQLTVDSGTELLFGVSCDSLCEEENEDANSSFAKALDTAQGEMLIRDIMGPFLSLFLSKKKFRNSLKSVHDFIDSYVQKALESFEEAEKKGGSESERYIFLREVARKTKDPLVLRGETMNVLIAGRDTTAVLLSNTWFILARRPDVWAKLMAEVESLGGVPPTYQDIQKMHYLRWVFSESLRLYPVLPINARTALRDTTIPVGGGPDGKSPVFIPKGGEVMWNAWSMQRRKDLYGEDAEVFRPERWEEIKPTWEYVPFNGGPRICLGQQYALTEASYTMIRMMQHIKHVEPRDSKPWTERMELVTSSYNGCKVSMPIGKKSFGDVDNQAT